MRAPAAVCVRVMLRVAEPSLACARSVSTPRRCSTCVGRAPTTGCRLRGSAAQSLAQLLSDGRFYWREEEGALLVELL